MIHCRIFYNSAYGALYHFKRVVIWYARGSSTHCQIRWHRLCQRHLQKWSERSRQDRKHWQQCSPKSARHQVPSQPGPGWTKTYRANRSWKIPSLGMSQPHHKGQQLWRQKQNLQWNPRLREPWHPKLPRLWSSAWLGLQLQNSCPAQGPQAVRPRPRRRPPAPQPIPFPWVFSLLPLSLLPPRNVLHPVQGRVLRVVMMRMRRGCVRGRWQLGRFKRRRRHMRDICASAGHWNVSCHQHFFSFNYNMPDTTYRSIGRTLGHVFVNDSL